MREDLSFYLQVGVIVFLTIFTPHLAFAKQPIVCDGQYVLCNAAPCQQIPGMKDRALCECSLWKGTNVGYSTCQQRKPQAAPFQQTKLLSTFSLGGMHYKYMHCKAKTPWTNCLDQSCFVDKTDPRKAHCNCKIEQGTNFVTFAGMCDTSNCDKSMWSGALSQDNLKFIKLISEHTGLKKTPIQACEKP